MKPSHTRQGDDERAAWAWCFGASTVLVFLAYGGVLDNYFHEIDDGLHLNGVVEGVYASPRFLPAHFGWIRLLHFLFGVEPAGYYAAGLVLHALSSTILGVLVQRLTRRLFPALVAVVVFSVLFAPHEVVLWFTASCGLLSVFFALLATLAWDAFLLDGRRRFHWIATSFALLAMGSKEDSAVLAPLLLGLDRLRNGRAWTQGIVRRYVVLGALGVAYIAMALRPENWAGARNGGRYDLRPELVPKLISNYALLFWPRSLESDRIPTWALPAGLGILFALSAAGWRYRKTIPVISYGLLISLCGLLPVLPGPFPNIAQLRYAYPSAIGIGLIAGGLAAALGDAIQRLGPSGRLWLRAAGIVTVTAWASVQILSIRSIERWRFERRCTHFKNAMESTKSALAADGFGAGALTRAEIIGPDIWDPYDYVAGLHALVGLPKDYLEIHFLSIEEVLRKLDQEAWLSTSTTRVYVGNEDGSISAIRRKEDLPLSLWRKIAAGSAERGFGQAVALVSVEKPREGI